ncbi:PadR family transcriptional regulator [Streptomyces sp. NPDC054766]
MADARLTTASYLVLGTIDKLGEASAYDVKVEAARTVAPFWSVPHAQVYAQCDRLLEAGLLSQVRQESGRNRRVLTLTDQGRAALRGWLEDPAFVPVEARERGILKLWFGGRPELLGPVQLDEHHRTLDGYEELAESVGELLTRGQRDALEFGIRYERMMIDFWQWVQRRGEDTDGDTDGDVDGDVDGDTTDR